MPKPRVTLKVRIGHQATARLFNFNGKSMGYVRDSHSRKEGRRPWFTRWTKGKKTTPTVVRRKAIPLRGPQFRNGEANHQEIKIAQIKQGRKKVEIVVKPKRKFVYREFQNLLRAYNRCPELFPKPIAFKENPTRGPGELHMARVEGLPVSSIQGSKIQLHDRYKIQNRIAKAINRMHRSGMTHNDLQLKNVIMDEKTGKVTIIDLEKMKFVQEKRGIQSVEERMNDILKFIGSAIEQKNHPRTGRNLQICFNRS